MTLSFKQFVNESYYYHGTSPENANVIKEKGFDSKKSLHGGKMFLTTNFGEASKYAKIANKGKPGVVLKIHKDNLSSEHMSSGDSPGIITYTGSIDRKHIKGAI